MESMEPKDIDWSRVVSHYVRDETYEGIQAPRWVDLDDPEAVAVDDDAWFCRLPFRSSLRLPLPRARALSVGRSPLLRGGYDRESERETHRSDGFPRLLAERGPRIGAILLIWGWIRRYFLATFVSVLAKFRLCFSLILLRRRLTSSPLVFSADCRHPKTAEDFIRMTPSPKGKLLRSVSAMLPFGERDTNLRDANDNNLKRRGAVPGGGTAAFASPTKPKAAPRKRFQDDAENQDPALTTPPPAASRPPFVAPRWAKNAIKSSAVKRPDNAEREALLSKNTAPRQLKSTLSARNLFSGKDILGQISDFYNELKRMAGGGGNQHPVSEAMEEMSPIRTNDSDVVEKVDCSSCGRIPLEAVKEVARQETVEKSPSPMKGKKIGLKVEAGKQRSPSVLREVKATPPTPQQFPSPSVNRVKNVKAAGMATSSSPLKKPLKDKVTPNKDQENSRDSKRQPFGVKDMNNTRSCDAEESSSGVFWFLKPCTFLVE